MDVGFREKFLSQLKWQTLPGKFLNPGPHSELYEKTYLHWLKMWVDILDSGSSTLSDDFIRQDLLCPLSFRGEVIGLIGCNFFNLHQQVTHDHGYAQPFPKELFHAKRGRNMIMSIEYLSVLPEFRKSILNFSLGDVLLGLSMKIFSESSSDFVLGTARRKIHVDEMCHRFGFETAGETEKYGLYCALIVNRRGTLRDHPDSEVQSLVEGLWLQHKNQNQDLNTINFAREAAP